MSSLVLSLLLSVAVAQQPVVPDAPAAPVQLRPDLLQHLAVPPTPDANAEIAYANADAPLKRWPDADGSSGQLKKGDRLTVVVRRPDGLARVAHGGDFGWVPDTLLSAEAVQADPVAPALPTDAPPADAPPADAPPTDPR